MKFTVDSDDGTTVEFECADTLASQWTTRDIIAGKTYPFLPFADDVQIVFDVGANCGAASVYLARHYPDAAIHSFEPGREPRAILERNAAQYSNITVHPIGLGAIDEVVPLYQGDGDIGMGSLFRRSVNRDESEPVQIRAGGSWAAERGIARIDVLKVDVEGSEVNVLESLLGLLPTVKVLYLEYDSRQSRRAVDAMLEPTHELYTGLVFLDQGECIYIRKELADLESATEHLMARWRGETSTAAQPPST